MEIDVETCSISLPSGATFETIPALGAHLFKLSLVKDQRVIQIINPPVAKDKYLSFYDTHFFGTKLFPFPNRIAQSKYVWNNKAYTLKSSRFQYGNAIHGLVSNRRFEKIKTKQSNALSFSTEFSSDEFPGYPFAIRCAIRFTLLDSSLRIQTEITNLTPHIIPIGDGWHPYFHFSNPLQEIELKIPPSKILELNKVGLPTGRKQHNIAFQEFMKIGNQAFDHSFELEAQNKFENTYLRNKAQDYSIKIEQQTGRGEYNYLQIYTPPDRSSIAIEPMSCPPNAFNEEIELIGLAPFQCRHLELSISLD